MAQNTSSAVMAQRREPPISLDDFPTQPWATRALIRHVIGYAVMPGQVAWEPACGRGHMARPLAEAFDRVHASDVFDYGFGAVADFLWFGARPPAAHIDWVITNPPFRLAEQFICRALDIARCGVAMFVRLQFLEGIDRWRHLYNVRPPSIIAVFTERVPLFRGRLDPSGSTATAYAWIAWHTDREERWRGWAPTIWIPPCWRELERPEDYEPMEKGHEHATLRDLFPRRD